MKKIKVFVLILVTSIILIFNFNSLIENLLNKKYIVNEISETNNSSGLEGIQKSIDMDYTSFRWIIFLNSIYLIILSIHIIYLNLKKKQ